MTRSIVGACIRQKLGETNSSDRNLFQKVQVGGLLGGSCHLVSGGGGIPAGPATNKTVYIPISGWSSQSLNQTCPGPGIP